MEKKSQDFSMDDAMRLAKSLAGQQLMSMLQQADPATLQEASRQANAGNYEQASRILSQLVSSPEAKDLIKALGG